MARWKLVAAAIVAILAIIVAAQNTQAVETKLLFITITMPRAVLLFVTLVIGFAIGVLVAEKLTRGRRAKADRG